MREFPVEPGSFPSRFETNAVIVAAPGRHQSPGFPLSSIGWRRGLGRGGAFLLVSPLLGPPPLVPRGERMESLMQPCRRAGSESAGAFIDEKETSGRPANRPGF